MTTDASPRTKVIINPEAGSGQTSDRWPSIRDALNRAIGAFDTSWTSAPGEAASMTRAALQDAYERIIAVGGDGTLNECINGYLDNDKPIRPRSVLAYVACGTGEDFRRTLEAPDHPQAAAGALSHTRTRQIDVGKATYRTPDDTAETRYFANMSTLGLGGAVVHSVRPSRSRWFGSGTIAYLYAILRTLLTYKNQPVDIHVDGDHVQHVPLCHVSVANGRFLAGGLPMAPDAQPDDGLLNIVVLGDFSRLRLLRYAYRFYAGTHEPLDDVEMYRGRSIDITSPSARSLFLEADGEFLGHPPVSFEVLPQALRFQY